MSADASVQSSAAGVVPLDHALYPMCIVTPVFGGGISVALDVAQSLSALGVPHELVDMRGFAAAYQQAAAARTAEAQRAFFDLTHAHVLSRALSGGCRLLLTFSLAPLRAPLLQELRRAGVVTAMWHVEHFVRFSGYRNVAAEYDHFFRIQEDPFAEELDALGVQSHSYLPLAANVVQPPGPGRALVGEDRAESCEVAFFGSPYANRLQLLAQLTDFDLALWGKGFSEVGPPLSRHVRVGDRLLGPEDAPRIYGGADIVLNPHSVQEGEWPLDFLNPRLFLLAARGHFQLTDERTLLRRHFSELEVASFRTPAQLVDRVRYFLAHPQERLDMADAARRRALREHTYAQRLRDMLFSLTPQVRVASVR